MSGYKLFRSFLSKTEKQLHSSTPRIQCYSVIMNKTVPSQSVCPTCCRYASLLSDADPDFDVDYSFVSVEFTIFPRPPYFIVVCLTAGGTVKCNIELIKTTYFFQASMWTNTTATWRYSGGCNCSGVFMHSFSVYEWVQYYRTLLHIHADFLPLQQTSAHVLCSALTLMCSAFEATT